MKIEYNMINDQEMTCTVTAGGHTGSTTLLIYKGMTGVEVNRDLKYAAEAAMLMWLNRFLEHDANAKELLRRSEEVLRRAENLLP